MSKDTVASLLEGMENLKPENLNGTPWQKNI
jgi:hypothetical protein